MGELRGQRYYLWSGQPTPTSTEQRIYVSAMRNPWTLLGPRVMLARPELSWELSGTPKVNEGPGILQHAGTPVDIDFAIRRPGGE